MYDEFKLQGQLKAAKEDGILHVAANLLKTGIAIEQICTVTGLSAEQVEELRK